MEFITIFPAALAKTSDGEEGQKEKASYSGSSPQVLL